MIKNEVSYVSSLEVELERKVSASFEGLQHVGMVSGTLGSIISVLNTTKDTTQVSGSGGDATAVHPMFGSSRSSGDGNHNHIIHSIDNSRNRERKRQESAAAGGGVKSYLATLLQSPTGRKRLDGFSLTSIESKKLPLFNSQAPFEYIGTRKEHSNDIEGTDMKPNIEKLTIYLDWSMDDRMFTHLNYKALESFMAVYPAAAYRAIVPAPTQHYLHKTSNIISNTMFQKYSKRGYDISVNAVGPMSKSRQAAPEYWEKYSSSCCGRCNKDCRATDHTQPMHLLTYIRLSKLYANGGIFTDFTHLLLGPISSSVVQHGFLLNTMCARKRDLPSWSVETTASAARNQYFQYSKKLRKSGNRGSLFEVGSGAGYVDHQLDQQECMTSSLFVFHAPKSTLLQCVLNHYNDPAFLECVEGSTWSRSADDSLARYEASLNHSSSPAGRNDGGADCVHKAFDTCFAQNGRRNGLDALSPHAFNALHQEAVVQARAQSHSVAAVGAEAGAGGESEDGRVGATALLVESFGGDAVAAREYLLPEAGADTEGVGDWVLSSGTVRVVWLGSLANSGRWLPQPYAPQSLLANLVDGVRLTRAGPMERQESCYVHRRTESGRCSTYTSSLPAVVEAGITPSSFHTGREEQSCAPQIVIPGFYKSASSFVFNMVAAHPQVLMPLVGAQMKETNCYNGQSGSVSKLRKRAFCFPYIEPTENYVTIDGTVYYATDATTPHSLVADNPSLKVIFSVRQPTERLYSNFKFAIQTFQKFGAFDSFVHKAFDQGLKFGRLRQMVANVVADKDFVLLLNLVRVKHRRLMKARTGVDIDLVRGVDNVKPPIAPVAAGGAGHGHLRGSAHVAATEAALEPLPPESGSESDPDAGGRTEGKDADGGTEERASTKGNDADKHMLTAEQLEGRRQQIELQRAVAFFRAAQGGADPDLIEFGDDDASISVSEIEGEGTQRRLLSAQDEEQGKTLGQGAAMESARVRSKRAPSAEDIRKRNEASRAKVEQEQEEERERHEELDPVEQQLLDHLSSSNNTEMVALMNYYFTESFAGPGTLATIMMHSIQFVGVLHYIKVVGIDNVLIVRDTDLNVDNGLVFQGTMDRIFSFIGLCGFKIPGGTKATLVNKNHIEPQEYDISSEMADRLNRFFEPFMEVMDALLLIQSIKHLKTLTAREKIHAGAEIGFVNSEIILTHKPTGKYHSITNNSAVVAVPANSYTNQKFKYDNTSTAEIAKLFATPEWFETSLPIAKSRPRVSLYMENGGERDGSSGDGSLDQNVEYNSTLGMLASF